MFNLLHLLNHKLDLDAEFVESQTFESLPDDEVVISESDGPWHVGYQAHLAWLAPLLKHGLDSNASAVKVRRDEAERCLRQFLLVENANSGSAEWVELGAMAWPLAYSAIRAVRLIAFMVPWGVRGAITYRYRSEWQKAACRQESRDEIIIRFPEHAIDARGRSV